MKKIFTCFTLLLVLVSCKKELTNTTADVAKTTDVTTASVISLVPEIAEHRAEPDETDAAIKTNTLGDPVQYAYLPKTSSLRKDRLYIFIPGTWATPGSYNDVCKAAAYAGYYSFGVSYSNLSPIEWQLGSNVNDSTAENIFEEYLTGNNTSPKVNVTRANSFENRIIKMILYMDSLYPAENWKRFLTANNEIRWEKLSVAGHSQGSDHTMYISKKRPLFRASFFAGPGSFKLPNGQYPGFMQQPGITPSVKLYGFNHTQDKVRVWSEVKVTWQVLGLPGSPDNVDDRKINGAHQLTTSYPVNDQHSGIIQDDLTPKDENGNPLYAPVWQYMGFPQ